MKAGYGITELLLAGYQWDNNSLEGVESVCFDRQVA